MASNQTSTAKPFPPRRAKLQEAKLQEQIAAVEHAIYYFECCAFEADEVKDAKKARLAWEQLQKRLK